MLNLKKSLKLAGVLAIVLGAAAPAMTSAASAAPVVPVRHYEAHRVAQFERFEAHRDIRIERHIERLRAELHFDRLAMHAHHHFRHEWRNWRAG